MENGPAIFDGKSSEEREMGGGKVRMGKYYRGLHFA